MAVASIQDRTSEFKSVLAQAQRRQNQSKVGSQRRSLLTDAQKTAADGDGRPKRSDFARKAAEIGRGISATMGKLEKLAQLAKRRTLFDDRPVEINELTFVIKQDLSSLNQQIGALQTLTKQQHPKADQEGEHNKNVVYLLQGKLTDVSVNFKDVLEARTKNIQASRSRTENFISSVSQHTQPSLQQSASPLYGTPNRASPAPGASDTLSLNPVGDQQLLMMEEAQPTNTYIQQRGEAIEAIEKTISELGGIFSQLATMVSEQSEMIQRIDANTEDVVDNVEGAQRELMKYWSRVSSNRWLIAQMFGVLMIFFLFVHLASNWSQGQNHTTRRPFGHMRSFSSFSATESSHKPRTPSKFSSTSHLRSGSTASSPRPSLDDEMSTLPDPRHRALSPGPGSGAASPHHPDLSQEVATLSTKLINAINHQTVLDDTLSETRHELDAARETIRELEAKVASQREILAGDVWIRRSNLDAEKRAMQAEKKTIQAKLTEETNKRIETEKEKKKIEQELENLTTALFEEANNMVIRAKEEAQAEQEVQQRKIDQLKAQLVDSEGLLKSQQEQLSELKHVMESMAEEQHVEQSNGTAPSSPGFARHDITIDDGLVPDGGAPSPASESCTPAHPMSFQHLIQPILRTDLSSYDDFVTLARVSRKRAGSRVSSGSLGGLNALSLGLGGSTSSAHPSNASTTSLSASVQASNSAPQSPNTPASTVSASSASGIPLPALKETRFFKRVLTEDIEPTLRLDAAPGLSWLARRSVISAVSDGTLVVEPVPLNTPIAAIVKPQFSPCSLCGESRQDPMYLRTHRFRTSEAESAQRYPLCKYCLNRVRSTCEFLGFLRMVKDGHWRADGDDLEKAAWEESVRLREHMFWCRVGGGVIPAGLVPVPFEAEKSPRVSQDLPAETPAETPATEQSEPFVDAVESISTKPSEETITASPTSDASHSSSGDKSTRLSTQSLDTKNTSGTETPKRLSITIPTTD
ncbi:Integral membrane protein sed5 [Paramyrothecium foliicola]|nr:Integral membrane protein sed5 [Paramyrothecium foliicola]